MMRLEMKCYMIRPSAKYMTIQKRAIAFRGYRLRVVFVIFFGIEITKEIALLSHIVMEKLCVRKVVLFLKKTATHLSAIMKRLTY